MQEKQGLYVAWACMTCTVQFPYTVCLHCNTPCKHMAVCFKEARLKAFSQQTGDVCLHRQQLYGWWVMRMTSEFWQSNFAIFLQPCRRGQVWIGPGNIIVCVGYPVQVCERGFSRHLIQHVRQHLIPMTWKENLMEHIRQQHLSFQLIRISHLLELERVLAWADYQI